jgi:Family of unknown function (DUF5762)
MNQNTGTIPNNSYDEPIKPIIKKNDKGNQDNSGNNTDPSLSSQGATFSEGFDTFGDESPKPKLIPFFTEDPNVLFQQSHMFEFFPTDGMEYNQKLNAISRTVLILTIISFIFTKSIRTILVGAITLTAIYIMHFYHTKEQQKVESKKMVQSATVEGFGGPGLAYFEDNNIPVPTDLFTTPDSSNPFSNVLMTDYDYNPNKKPAPPAFAKDINKQILAQAKQLVNDANPDQPNISDKLFKDLGEQLMFEQSLNAYTSNPATTIPNDQGAFAEFCYGSMISCKEGNKFACARNMSHYTNY